MTSLLTLSLALLSYEKANRWADPHKGQISGLGSLLIFGWRYLMVAHRVMALAQFGTAFTQQLFLFIFLHWILMDLWIFMMVKLTSLIIPTFMFTKLYVSASAAVLPLAQKTNTAETFRKKVTKSRLR